MKNVLYYIWRQNHDVLINKLKIKKKALFEKEEKDIMLGEKKK